MLDLNDVTLVIGVSKVERVDKFILANFVMVSRLKFDQYLVIHKVTYRALQMCVEKEYTVFTIDQFRYQSLWEFTLNIEEGSTYSSV